MLSVFERKFGDIFSVSTDRLRAMWLSMRGANLGSRIRLGKRVHIQRPWCLSIGDRSQLEHQVHIKATNDKTIIKMGKEVFVGFNCEFDISEKLIVGDHVLIAPGCFITDHNHRHAADKLIAEQGCENAVVTLEDDVWIGAHVVILPGVTVGRGAIVAAGSVVNRNVESMSIVAGVPAKPIGRRA